MELTKLITSFNMKWRIKMERSLELMKENVFQFNGDLEAKLFEQEIDAQSIVEDYRWMISEIEKLKELETIYFSNAQLIDYLRVSANVFGDKERIRNGKRSF